MICFAILWWRFKDLEIFCFFLRPLFKFIPHCDQHSLPLKLKRWLHFHSLTKWDFFCIPWSSNVLSFFLLGERLKSPLKIMPWGYFSLIPFRETWKHMALEAAEGSNEAISNSAQLQASPWASAHTQSSSALPVKCSSAETRIKAQWTSIRSDDVQPLKDGSCWKGWVRSQTSVAKQTNLVNLHDTAEQIFLCGVVPVHGMGGGK